MAFVGGHPGGRMNVRGRLQSWIRPLAGFVAFSVASAGLAPVAAAADKGAAGSPAPTLRASAKAAVTAKPLPKAALAQAAPGQPTHDAGSKGFFSTTTGRIALVVMAAGTGYMVYSAFKDNDPVKSVFR